MAGEHILLVEDSDAVAMGLEYGLVKEGYTVSRAATISEAEIALGQQRIDLFVLDVRLPDGSGFDFCRELRKTGQRQPVMMLTARDEMIDKIIGLELGADDYMTKPFELRELIARLRSLLRRSYGSLAEGENTRINIGDLTIDLNAQRVTRAAKDIDLTATEFKMLAYLAQQGGKAISREALYTQIWGDEPLAGTTRSVDVHIRNLRQKIEHIPSQPRLIATVRGIGYRLEFPV